MDIFCLFFLKNADFSPFIKIIISTLIFQIINNNLILRNISSKKLPTLTRDNILKFITTDNEAEFSTLGEYFSNVLDIHLAHIYSKKYTLFKSASIFFKTNTIITLI